MKPAKPTSRVKFDWPLVTCIGAFLLAAAVLGGSFDSCSRLEPARGTTVTSPAGMTCKVVCQ